ncbi:hypothetical protein [Variovorax ginsengisoli]|uniref:Cysteine dioxygenase type I n=1 Tax=Variovorax ginsengisoli TaxID=363844 RepID=A0ABT8SDL1_9BURK|nr:hypothetical protein [Variovorax ginsengisoli]MDN8617841.1 hypothetical protein [Variovorax ginsengisoli]MDO1537011.1 hypothetical protein [Variovorax ginsengisoli]
MKLRTWLRNLGAARAPDFIIGGAEDPYLLRWWLIPRNRFFNVYLHCFKRSDDDRALHDHPWLFNCSWLLDGQYMEHTPAGQVERRAGALKFRWGPAPHRVELLTVADSVASQPDNRRPIPCWTLFVTGPRVREWGFYCDRGWVHWKWFTAPGDKGAVGKGCDA